MSETCEWCGQIEEHHWHDGRCMRLYSHKFQPQNQSPQRDSPRDKAPGDTVEKTDVIVNASGVDDFCNKCGLPSQGLALCNKCWLTKDDDFCLSDKRQDLFEIMSKEVPTKAGRYYRIIKEQDKEFVRRLKELADEGIDGDGCVIPVQWFKDEIDKLAGKELSQ